MSGSIDTLIKKGEIDYIIYVNESTLGNIYFVEVYNNGKLDVNASKSSVSKDPNYPTSFIGTRENILNRNK